MGNFHFNAKTASILVLIGATLSGLVGPFDRMLEELEIGYFAVTYFRSIVTVAILAIMMVVIDRTLFKIKKEHILLFILLGVCKGVMDLTYVHSQSMISLSLSTVLQMTAPYFLILLGVIIFKDKVTKKKIIAVLIGTMSACLISNVFLNPGSISATGVIIGLISGITYAGYMMSSSVLMEKGYNVLTILFWAFLITVVITVPTLPIATTLPTLAEHPEAIGYLLILGIGCTLIPYMFDAIGVKYVDVTAVTVFSMLEIAVSAVVGWLLYNEDMNLWMVLGMILLLVSMLLINEKKKEHGAEQENIPPENKAEAPPQT